MIRRPPRSTLDRSSAASDVYKRQVLRGIGATHVCDSSAPTFMTDLVDAITATGAMLAFDATGGGTLASQVLTAMEIAASRGAGEYSRYGSATHKQVYILSLIHI